MSLSIVHYNDPVLRRKGEKITIFDPALAHLAEEMIAAMHEAEGIGLGAPQVGRSLQLCVIDLLASEAEYGWELDGARPPRELFMPLVLANPRSPSPRRRRRSCASRFRLPEVIVDEIV